MTVLTPLPLCNTEEGAACLVDVADGAPGARCFRNTALKCFEFRTMSFIWDFTCHI